jgi:WD40 repeat protein
MASPYYLILFAGTETVYTKSVHVSEPIIDWTYFSYFYSLRYRFTHVLRFEQVLLLPGHRAAIWGLDVAPDGSFCMTVGQDRSLRVWERTDDLVFVEEERYAEVAK